MKPMELIRHEMKTQRMTQKTLSEKSGVTYATLTRYINGTRIPKIDDFNRMADALGIKVALIIPPSKKVSLLCNDKECFICGRTDQLQKHHIYKGIAKRDFADDDGCWVWLCPEHHTMSKEAVHLNTPFNITLEKFCQYVWEVNHDGNREEFRERYVKSYL